MPLLDNLGNQWINYIVPNPINIQNGSIKDIFRILDAENNNWKFLSTIFFNNRISESSESSRYIESDKQKRIIEWSDYIFRLVQTYKLLPNTLRLNNWKQFMIVMDQSWQKNPKECASKIIESQTSFSTDNNVKNFLDTDDWVSYLLLEESDWLIIFLGSCDNEWEIESLNIFINKDDSISFNRWDYSNGRKENHQLGEILLWISGGEGIEQNYREVWTLYHGDNITNPLVRFWWRNDAYREVNKNQKHTLDRFIERLKIVLEQIH